MRQACKIHGGITLSPEQERDALMLMRISPSALMYSLRPDGMIVTHREGGQAPMPVSDEVAEFDRTQFMRSLVQCFTLDFRMAALAEVYFKLLRIDRMQREVHLVVRERDHQVVLDLMVPQHEVIGEWHEKDAKGNSRYVHVSALPSYWQSKGAKPPENPDGLT